jgi:hexosaminidase
MKQLLLTIFLFAIIQTSAQNINIIPKPLEVKATKGTSCINAQTIIVAADSITNNSADFLTDYLKKYYNLKLKIQKTSPKSNYILLNVKKFIVAPKTDGYTLTVSTNNISIQGDTYPAVFYGVQSLIQLLPITNSKSAGTNSKLQIPNAIITDQPRFSYRGTHLDVSRHFFPVSFIKQYIDYLALHKLNTFHWHLTDDQGWRIEIKKYPKLTSVGGWRNGTIIGRYPGKGNDSIHYGGFYTQEEVKDVVQYAATRFITVIPEIEMPGHASAAIAAYPELSCFPDEDTKPAKGTAWAGSTKGKQVQQAWGVFEDVFCAGKESTFTMMQNILDEVMPLFPSKYIHIGGDECPKANWKRCPDCQRRIKEQGLKDEHQLQSYFIQRIEKYINSKGKNIIGWDEILEGGLAPNATVMSWRGEQGGIDAAKQNHDVVMTPGGWCYFDHAQSSNEDSVTIGSYLPIEKVYSYDPVPQQLNAEEAKHILGAQANLWTEYIGNTRKVEYMLFPRIAALSEILWTAKTKKDSADFERRLETQFMRYDMWKVNYSKAFWELRDVVMQSGNKIAWKLTSKNHNVKAISVSRLDSIAAESNVFIPKRLYGNSASFNIESSGRYMAVAYDNISVTGKFNFTTLSPGAQTFKYFYFNKATGKKITTTPPPSPSYPGNGGAFGFVNGIRADKFNSPEWLGWTKPVEITIDLGKTETLTEIILHVWKQEPSWIYLPENIELIFSYKDAHGITQFTSLEVDKPEEGWGEDRHLKFTFDPQQAFAVTIKLKPLMKIPEGRQGAGNPAWMFLDEIEIN